MASIQTLPLEIRSAIFQFTLGQLPLRSRTVKLLAQYRAHIHTLTTLSLVCKEWRSTVLSDGTLWTTLPVDTSRTDCQQSTTTVLERSKQAMLDVSIVCDDEVDSINEAFFSEISKNMHRIRTLHLDTTFPETLCSLSTPAPKLEMLRILTAEQPMELGFLFGGKLPALRSLVLAGISSWPPGLFSNLKDLRLILSSSHPTVRVSSLIDIVSRSPNIEQIKISAFLSMVDDSPPSSLVRLPNLQKFTMRDCDSATVLSHTIVPATADVKVVMDHSTMRTTMHIPSQNLHILSSVPEDISTMGFLTESTVLVIQQDHKVGFGIGFYRSHSSQPSLRVLDRSASIDSFARRSIDVLASRSHHFKNIKELSFVLSAGITVPWPMLLRGFKQLEQLSMIASYAPSILYTLLAVWEDGHPICPALKQLNIYERDGDKSIFLDRDDMARFVTARKTLDCAAAEVIIRGPEGKIVWECGSSGD